MYWDMKKVQPLSNYRIYVEIENGQKGVFDMNPHLMDSCQPHCDPLRSNSV